MKKLSENLIFQLGSAFLTLGVLSVTFIPFLIKHMDFMISPTHSTFVFIAFLFYTTGAILYALSFGYYKKQLVWIIQLVILYSLFQLFVKAVQF